MNDNVLHVVTVISVLGCGLVAGAFFAFSTFVMPALARLPAPQGIAAMQAINVAAINPLFMTALFGTGLSCVVAAVLSLVRWHAPASALCLAAAVLYVVGTTGVTILFNVPQNEALAAIDPEGMDAASAWKGFVSAWTAWNHVRAVAALLAAALFTFAIP